MTLNEEKLVELTPGAQALYREMLERFDELRAYGILDSVLRARHFMAQILHETGGLQVLVENLNYRAERLVKVWPSRFPTPAAALPYAHNPRKLANKVYGGRLGNVEENDGWRYIGRGFLQLTGRDSYRRIGAALGLDLEASPSLVLYPEHGLRIAAEIWKQARCNASADIDSIEKVTRAINGGQIGIEDRRVWYRRMQAVVVDDVIHQ